MNLLQNPANTNLIEKCSQSQKEFWLDLYVTLLYDEGTNRKTILTILAQHSLKDGKILVQRLINRPSLEVIWEKSRETAQFVTYCLLTTAFTICPPPSCLSPLAIHLVKFEKTRKQAIDVLMKMVEGNEFITSSHMYLLSETLSKEVNFSHSHILFDSFLTCILS